MARHRIEADRVQTQLENKRRFEDRACSIDDALDEAIGRIDWQRREMAHASLLDFV